VPVHWLEAALEDWALLDLVPVVEHETVLYRAADLLLSTWDHLLFVCVDSLNEGGHAIAGTYDALEKVRNIADAVVQPLAAICYRTLAHAL
jgi:hypothetical protein